MPRRANYRGRPVLFPLGVIPLAAAGVAAAAGPSRWLIFLIGVGCLGLCGRGPLVELAREVVAPDSPGLAAIGAELLIDVLVLALAAHLGNLLDTRPGRPEKAVGLVGVGVCLGSWSLAPLEPIAPLVPAVAICSWLTLRERAMLGDAGASLIGGMIGILLVTTLPMPGILLVLAGLIVISLYGEFRSISAAIGRVPLLERLDSIGRVN